MALNLPWPSLNPGAPEISGPELQDAVNVELAKKVDTSAGSTSPTVAGSALLSWPSASGSIVTSGIYQMVLAWPWQTGIIVSVVVTTGNGSFIVAVNINGQAVAALGTVPVTGVTPVTVLAGTNTVTVGASLALAISGDVGLPTDAAVQVNFTHSLI